MGHFAGRYGASLRTGIWAERERLPSGGRRCTFYRRGAFDSHEFHVSLIQSRIHLLTHKVRRVTAKEIGIGIG